ncbi:MAG: hypothetical protein ABIQ17_05665 [Candidatus Limnocylindrales bacterium]
MELEPATVCVAVATGGRLWPSGLLGEHSAGGALGRRSTPSASDVLGREDRTDRLRIHRCYAGLDHLVILLGATEQFAECPVPHCRRGTVQ